LPPPRTGSRPPGGKSLTHMRAGYLSAALADFSGYLASDEVYDGPFCVLSVVDNRRYNRLAFAVLDHDPTHDDIRAFLKEVRIPLNVRELVAVGITTGGSPLYPKPLQEVWPSVPHQVCEFHVLKEITKAVLHALAKLRKQLTAAIPKQPRGRPGKQRQAQARVLARKQQRARDLFTNRHLFVRHHLRGAQKALLRRLTRGLRQLRALRAIMDEVYRLLDRRCKAQTALRKLARLRRRVQRFKQLGAGLDKLKSPNLEEALEFLDDELLPSTSNAVERGNRRLRKAQGSIYSVRTKSHLEQRIALDMEREQRAPRRKETLESLHAERSLADSLH
jgi:hypothetical protein